MSEDEKTSVGEAAPLLGAETIPTLTVVTGVEVGRVLKLSPGEAVIGRAEGADFQLADEGISRHHAKITLDGEHCRVQDLGSTNGTYVNNQRIQSQELFEGDRVQLGRVTVLAFRHHHPAEEAVQKQLMIQASRDPATGVFSVQHFRERLQGEFSYAARHGGALAVIVVSLECPSEVDADRVAQHYSEVLKAAVRTEDVLARTGGLTFAVLSREGETVAARNFAVRLQQLMAEAPLSGAAANSNIGVACFGARSYREPEELLRAAEYHLSLAREAGAGAIEGP